MPLGASPRHQTTAPPACGPLKGEDLGHRLQTSRDEPLLLEIPENPQGLLGHVRRLDIVTLTKGHDPQVPQRQRQCPVVINPREQSPRSLPGRIEPQSNSPMSFGDPQGRQRDRETEPIVGVFRNISTLDLARARPSRHRPARSSRLRGNAGLQPASARHRGCARPPRYPPTGHAQAVALCPCQHTGTKKRFRAPRRGWVPPRLTPTPLRAMPAPRASSPGETRTTTAIH